MKGGDVTAHRGSVGARAGTKKEEGARVATRAQREWETGRLGDRETKKQRPMWTWGERDEKAPEPARGRQ